MVAPNMTVYPQEDQLPAQCRVIRAQIISWNSKLSQTHVYSAKSDLRPSTLIPRSYADLVDIEQELFELPQKVSVWPDLVGRVC